MTHWKIPRNRYGSNFHFTCLFYGVHIGMYQTFLPDHHIFWPWVVFFVSLESWKAWKHTMQTIPFPWYHYINVSYQCLFHQPWMLYLQEHCDLGGGNNYSLCVIDLTSWDYVVLQDLYLNNFRVPTYLNRMIPSTKQLRHLSPAGTCTVCLQPCVYVPGSKIFRMQNIVVAAPLPRQRWSSCYFLAPNAENPPKMTEVHLFFVSPYAKTIPVEISMPFILAYRFQTWIDKRIFCIGHILSAKEHIVSQLVWVLLAWWFFVWNDLSPDLTLFTDLRRNSLICLFICLLPLGLEVSHSEPDRQTYSYVRL